MSVSLPHSYVGTWGRIRLLKPAPDLPLGRWPVVCPATPGQPPPGQTASVSAIESHPFFFGGRGGSERAARPPLTSDAALPHSQARGPEPSQFWVLRPSSCCAAGWLHWMPTVGGAVPLSFWNNNLIWIWISPLPFTVPVSTICELPNCTFVFRALTKNVK